MAKRSQSKKRTGSAGSNEVSPRLGVVVRFTPGAGRPGIRQMEAAGFRVAASADFRRSASVPNDFDGANVQYFERFGIAIVRSDTERLKPMLQKAVAEKVVTAVRPERLYRPLGSHAAGGHLSGRVEIAQTPVDHDYLRGYRDGIGHLIDRLTTREQAHGIPPAAAFQETLETWGLQASLVPGSQLSGAGIRVAVLDTGFDERHPDFQGRMITKKLFATRSSAQDIDGHGTHCIGTACGPLRPTGVPRYGVAYGAHIFAGKVIGDDGFATDRSIIAGMDWAVDEGCQIISMSLGAATEMGEQPSDDYEQIGQVCLDAGTVVIAAAGNESNRPGRIAPVGSPANASTIMAVGAVDRQFSVASFSCGGMNPGQEVDIAAAGVDVLSSIPGGGHDRFNGTSMATPHVAGVAALIAESDQKYRGWALWARLLQLARPLSAPARDVGKGLLQAPRS